MHLKFLDTSPLKVFASRTRSMPVVCPADLGMLGLLKQTEEIFVSGMPSRPTVCWVCGGDELRVKYGKAA
jgi:hypothetical protein